MQFKSAVLFATSSLAILAAASPTQLSARQSCDTGSIQCCDSTTTTSDPVTSLLLGLLGIVVSGVDIPIGLNCSPISVVGVGGNSCSASPVCCTNTDNAKGLLSGLIGIGCVPVNLSL
ncbi:fungal hydrophobin [Punctularia strigosozonata HHB-11173 SS5]|uniref:fungal hydrophobin n=1 Tax=Punctularia strigosozonata (strain HHB-11173) TaxID=741275 RepID=UPI0004416B02|nr:fungal hydrophobin [Punctularia strigosozonata HHB-11173 SS5]EIN06927.1 fungal hydrophobin [Punctularia strigosozonata HHB-11173 SS5]